jgi:hypothetical protein
MGASPENRRKVRQPLQIDTIILRLQTLANPALSLGQHLSQPDSSDIQALLETTTNCPPTADWGTDHVSVPSPLWRDGARFQAIRLS